MGVEKGKSNVVLEIKEWHNLDKSRHLGNMRV
jgi:hypothetical protein